MVTAPKALPGEMPLYGRQYQSWLHDEHKVDSAKQENHYKGAVDQIKQQFATCPFWGSIINSLPDIDANYQLTNGVPLITGLNPEIYKKPYESFLNKTYRINIIDNEAWPAPPKNGWLLPPDWYSQVGDIVRTTLVVRYLDGVQFLLDEIARLAKKQDIELEYSLESRPEGYYAAHLSYKKEIELTTIEWGIESRSIQFEIQITTGVKQLIKSLLHKHYEEQRIRPARDTSDWQWDYKSEEFVANYLGHVIHYIEGMIVEVRDRQRG